jgi:hypothetical protein
MFPRPARVEPDCACEVTVHDDDGDRLPRVIRWVTDPYCPVHTTVPEAWERFQ